ncbi:UNKNOWN [Stylonychia lemnae]|uniref:Uncharacterized protein n=1 Tax=Stylonychia lemnae TaxID=5949 RepID=A0A078A662_STYLE|nr:UNKNOWN [Stylonychia lemnae]|eukprot:CDW77689.1 UNKNOWN [Stylonychia lemnae]
MTEVNAQQTFINSFLDKNRDAKTLLLCFSKESLNDFMLSLQTFINLIKTKTNQIFIPVTIQNNPMNPDEEFIVGLQCDQNLKKYEYQFFSKGLDEKTIADLFTLRTFQFETTDVDPNQKRQRLIAYDQHNLVLIGAIQAPNNANKLHLLMYTKILSQQDLQEMKKNPHHIRVEYRPSIANQKDFDILLNDQVVEDPSYYLRTVITFQQKADSRYHFVVFQAYPSVDKMYLVQNFPTQVGEENKALREKVLVSNTPYYSKNQSSTALKENNHIRYNLAEKLSVSLDLQYRAQVSLIAEFITNTSYEDSYLTFTA